MKHLLAVILSSCFCLSFAFATNIKRGSENESDKINLITEMYENLYEKKDIGQMTKYISRNLEFQINSNERKPIPPYSKSCVAVGNESDEA